MDRPQRLAHRQEIRSARYHEGRVTPRSGSGDQKGDVETGSALIECKHTQRKSFSLVLAAFLEHATRALLAHKRAVWEIEFTDPMGHRPQYLVVLDRDDYRSMEVELAELRLRLREMASELNILQIDASRLL